MLDLFRKKAQSPFLQATVVIIALVFVFFGVGSYQKGSRNEVATVNGEDIPIEQFKGAYQMATQIYKQRYGQDVPEEKLKDRSFQAQVINEMIQRSLLRQAAVEMGIGVSDAEVQVKIQEYASFKTDGIFDLERYRGTLAGSKMSISDFEGSIRNDLLDNKLEERLANFVSVTPREIEDRFSYSEEMIKLQYAMLTPASYKEKVDVNEEDLAAYFEQNRESYKTKREVKVRYTLFDFDEIAAEVVVPEEELLSYYNDNMAQYDIPEKRRARHILVKSDENDSPELKAEKRHLIDGLLARLRKGEDFAALAKEQSEDGSAAKGGDLGFFPKGRMVKPFEEAAFSLAAGEISDVVESRYGFHIIKVEEIQPAHQKTVDEAREEIENTLKKEKAKALTFDKANKVYEQIILAGSMEAYATQNDVKLAETDFFPQSKLDPAFKGLGKLAVAIFSLKKGELSSLMESPKGYAIMFLIDEKPSQVPEMGAVREKVVRDFTRHKAQQLAEEDAEVILAALKEGADFEAEAKKRSLTLMETEFFSRTRASSMAFPREFIDQGFTLSSTNPFPDKAINKEGMNFVYRFLEQKSAALTELTEEKRQTLEQGLLAEKKQMIMAGWLNNLRKQADISINPDFI